jgi:hypothetical protein
MVCLRNICINTLNKGDNGDGDDNVHYMMMVMLKLLLMMIRMEKICNSTSCVVKADIILALINDNHENIKHIHVFIYSIGIAGYRRDVILNRRPKENLG